MAATHAGVIFFILQREVSIICGLTVSPKPGTTSTGFLPEKGSWNLIFRQTINDVDELFKKNEWFRNENNEDAPNFSRLGDFENFRKPEGTFHLFLWYPELGKGNEWTQTSNPVTKTSKGVHNYQPLSIPYIGRWWGGLEHHNRGKALLDGSIHKNEILWWYALGSTELYESGIPGPWEFPKDDGYIVKTVELYVDLDHPGAVGPKLQFQLKGETGEEKVTISMDGNEEEFGLTAEWETFSYPRPSIGYFSVKFLNDAINNDVFIRGHESQVADLLPDFKKNKDWGCGTKNENERCTWLRNGELQWNGKYTYTLKGSYETDMLNHLDISNMLANSNMNSSQKKHCMKELEASTKKCAATEKVIDKSRFKKPFIRSTEVTDRLGRDTRLYTALRETCKRVGAGEHMMKHISEKFQESAKEGGGLSTLQTKRDPQIACSSHLRYRRIDGKCNNLGDKDRGSANIPLRRYLPNRYQDGVSIPRGGLSSSSLPSARVVSKNIHQGSEPNPLTTKSITHMAMQFGQFLDHDITLTADMELDCCNPEIHSMNPDICFNIDITGDDFYSGKTTCHSFTRSVGMVTDTEAREQINGITAFIDASNVYGSDDDLAKKLRTLTDGKLKVHPDGPMLPTRGQVREPVHEPAILEEDLVAGDMRAIVQPTLASMHSLFLNEHNRIADELKSRLSGFLSSKSQSKKDEIIYQETRKLVGAEMQNIVYDEYLPHVLGLTEYNRHNLGLDTSATQYNDGVDPSIRNEFATVAYRFGHSLIAGVFNGNGGRKLELSYFDEYPEFVSGREPYNNGKAWYSELSEASKQTSPAADVFCTEAITNLLFSNTRGAPSNFGEDLVARNIQRGRDHGIPPYNQFRVHCGLKNLSSFSDKPDEINDDNWGKLRRTYDGVNDIDAFTGGLAEIPPEDGLVGPTFACIIGKQFNALKFGDRFFFNNDEYGLKANSRDTVRQRTLGDIICDNTDIVTLQKHVMEKEDARNNPQQRCNSRNSLDFQAIVADIQLN